MVLLHLATWLQMAIDDCSSSGAFPTVDMFADDGGERRSFSVLVSVMARTAEVTILCDGMTKFVLSLEP